MLFECECGSKLSSALFSFIYFIFSLHMYVWSKDKDKNKSIQKALNNAVI